MANTGFVDVCRFNATSIGTGDFVVASAVTGYQTPALAGAVNGTQYRYRAEIADLTEWEVGYGVYTSGTVTLARTVVLYNSSGTGTGAGQSGAGSKVNFSGVPQVGIVLLAEDFIATGDIPGTQTNNSPTAGSIGELIGSTIASGSAVALTTGTPANITSISLTAGDWDVFGAITYNYGGTTNVTIQLSSISSTSATLDNTQGNYFVWRFGASGLVPQAEMGGFTIGPVRKSLASTTTIYLVGRTDFTVSTASGYGRLWARRVR